ncbi:hypothetical protein RRSWK_00100 [Rhodopirellula sp. SWK7]|nr:hypothetical protein RRSWK_00100 [Rhodopirellula sp. SWK7]
MYCDNHGDAPQFSALRYGGWLRHFTASATITKRGDLDVMHQTSASQLEPPMHTLKTTQRVWVAALAFVVVLGFGSAWNLALTDEQYLQHDATPVERGRSTAQNPVPPAESRKVQHVSEGELIHTHASKNEIENVTRIIEQIKSGTTDAIPEIASDPSVEKDHSPPDVTVVALKSLDPNDTAAILAAVYKDTPGIIVEPLPKMKCIAIRADEISTTQIREILRRLESAQPNGDKPQAKVQPITP